MPVLTKTNEKFQQARIDRLLKRSQSSSLLNEDKEEARDQAIRISEGLKGELISQEKLNFYFGESSVDYLFHDITLNSGMKFVQIDHMLINEHNEIYLMEMKNYKGLEYSGGHYYRTNGYYGYNNRKEIRQRVSCISEQMSRQEKVIRLILKELALESSYSVYKIVLVSSNCELSLNGNPEPFIVHVDKIWPLYEIFRKEIDQKKKKQKILNFFIKKRLNLGATERNKKLVDFIMKIDDKNKQNNKETD